MHLGIISAGICPFPYTLLGFTGGNGPKESTGQCRRPKRRGLAPWVRRIPWRRKWHPTSVFLPGTSYGQRDLVDCSTRAPEPDLTQCLGTHIFKPVFTAAPGSFSKKAVMEIPSGSLSLKLEVPHLQAGGHNANHFVKSCVPQAAERGENEVLKVSWGPPGGASGKEPTCQWGDVRDAGSIPGLGISPRGGHGNPLQYSCLEIPHRQRSQWGYTPWIRRVGQDWAT